MLRIERLACVLLLLIAPTAIGQDVAYEKYRLPNGMTVILHEDHSLPSVCLNIWYYVGAKDELDRRSGFAHLFEHLMFMGTHRVPEGGFDNIMEAGGGFNNASTAEDRTNYFSIGPAELLPTLLWLDADRLEALGKAMTQEKLDKQRDIVRNERRQSYENRPYGKASLRVHEMMFPKHHPYHIPVIGTHEDLEAATVDDVKNFFSTYYVPNNASLVLAGDFDPAEVRPVIKDLFGSLPRGDDVLHARAEPVELDGVKRLTMTDKVQFARTSIVYHSPPRFAPGDAEMDLVAGVLTDGISSRLYQKLIYENELAVSVRAYQDSMLLGSLFHIVATAKPGVELDTIEQAVDEVINEFIATGPTADELEKQKAQLEYRAISRLQSLFAKADRMNAYQFFFDEPNSFKRDLDRFRKATPADVQRWAAKTLTSDGRLILRVIPALQTAGPNPRDQRREADEVRPFTPLIPETFKLNNGVTVHHWKRSELPLVELTMLLPFGAASDPPVKAGLATLTADMLDEGAGRRSAIEFADALDLLGASFNAYADHESTEVSLSTLTRNFAPALELFADAVLRPKFDEKEWKRVHDLHIQRLRRALDRPTYVANTVAMRTFFGDDHPYSRPTSGTPTTAEAVTLNDIPKFHAQLFRPSNAVFLVAGDLTSDQVKEQLNKLFGAWSDPAEVTALSQPGYPAPANNSLRVAVVDRPDAVQTIIRFVMPGPTYADVNRPKLRLLNTILGGSFTSRLNQNLREEHGYTYGARSSYAMNPSVGYLSASSSVRADVTGDSVAQFLKEFAGVRSGNISTEEAEKARASRRMGMIQTFSGLGGIVSAGTTLVRNDRPFTELGEEMQAVARVTEADLNRLAYNAVPLEQGLLVLVGDKKLILEQLGSLELPTPIELTVTGDKK